MVAAATAGQAAALWAGLIVILMLVLSGIVVGRRRSHQVAFGHGGVPEMNLALRAFGNASEYAPVGLAALAILAVVDAPVVLVHAIGAALFAGRVVHALGLLVMQGTPSIGRVVGMLLTWLALLVAAISLLAYAVI